VTRYCKVLSHRLADLNQGALPHNAGSVGQTDTLMERQDHL
jgi:hypothetical protein